MPTNNETDPLSDDDKVQVALCADLVDDALEAIESLTVKTRDFALVRTKLEEAQMWLERGFADLGYSFGSEPDEEPDDDEEPEGDE